LNLLFRANAKLTMSAVGYVGRTLRVGFGDADLEVILGLDERIRLALEHGDVPSTAALRRERAAETRELTTAGASRFRTVRRDDGTAVSLSAEGTLLSVTGRARANVAS
jgi:hypothetical protein